MLSKKNIENEIGDGICIVPLKKDNIKENSINFSADKYAWLINNKTDGTCDPASFAVSGNKIIIPPHKVVVIFTKEVVAMNNCLGGTFHSKVGTTCNGLGAISTMIGPNYCGHLMVPVVNTTDQDIFIDCDDTFVSLILHKLDSPNDVAKNATNPGQSALWSRLGINMSQQQLQYLNEDWKLMYESVQEKLKGTLEYKKFWKERFLNKIKSISNYISIRTLLVILIFCLVSFSLWQVAVYLNEKTSTNEWTIALIPCLWAAILSLLGSINRFILKK